MLFHLINVINYHHLVMQRLGADLSDEVAAEAAWAHACGSMGPHNLIRQPEMRLFWFHCFGAAEQVALDAFWASFPKELDRWECQAWNTWPPAERVKACDV